MRARLLPVPLPVALAAVAAAALAAGCQGVECGEGTIQRDGRCVPSSETVGNAKCGPFTMLQGDACVPTLSPAVCDLSTTTSVLDTSTGVTTCLGGGGGCSAKLECPAPTDGKHTICGQLYDLETMLPFTDPVPTGEPCGSGATSGPCALGVHAFDAVAFATNPSTTAPLTTSPLYLDTCGRYRLAEITLPPTNIVAIGVDDAAPAMAGPAGLTNAAGVATAVVANKATENLDAFIARKATTDGWVAAGAPTIANGFYVPLFRGHKTGSDPAAGVTVTYGSMAAPPPTMTDAARHFYFGPEATARTTLAAAAGATGANGTALFRGANLGELYSGQGGLPAACRWDIHAGASTPGVVFVQVFRPISVPGMTCPL